MMGDSLNEISDKINESQTEIEKAIGDYLLGKTPFSADQLKELANKQREAVYKFLNHPEIQSLIEEDEQ